MGESTTAGTKVYIGTTASVGLTDTYTEIAEVTSISAYGKTFAEVTHIPLATRGVRKHKGSYNDGNLELEMADDPGDAGQIALEAALDTDFDYNVKIEQNDEVAPVSATVTISVATPGVVTDTAHGLAANTPVKFTTTGALPTGLVAGTTYYVKTVATADTYTLSATAGGTAIDTSSTQSGVHTRTTVPAPTTKYMKAKVMSFANAAASVDAVQGRTCTLGVKSGTISTVKRTPLS
jgi:hypothetical protein